MKMVDRELTRRVINLLFYEDASPPSELSPEEINAYIFGGIMVNQYTLKTGM